VASTGTVALLAMCALLVGATVNGAANWVNVGYAWDRGFGDIFELADRASDACTKAKFLGDFNNRLIAEGLNEGQSAAFYPRPTSDLASNFNVSKSLELRLVELCKLPQSDPAYQFGMNQVTLQEFCWFPINIFKQAYFMRHGIWGIYMPKDVENRCSSGGSQP